MSATLEMYTRTTKNDDLPSDKAIYFENGPKVYVKKLIENSARRMYGN